MLIGVMLVDVCWLMWSSSRVALYGYHTAVISAYAYMLSMVRSCSKPRVHRPKPPVYTGVWPVCNPNPVLGHQLD